MVYKQQMNPGSRAEEPVVMSVWPLRKPASPSFLTLTALACARLRGHCGRGDTAAPAECRAPKPTIPQFLGEGRMAEQEGPNGNSNENVRS